MTLRHGTTGKKPKSCTGTQVRLTMSIPASLHERMIRCIEDRNWSAMAAAVFDKACCEVEDGTSDGEMTVEDRLYRLERILGVQ